MLCIIIIDSFTLCKLNTCGRSVFQYICKVNFIFQISHRQVLLFSKEKPTIDILYQFMNTFKIYKRKTNTE